MKRVSFEFFLFNIPIELSFKLKEISFELY